MKINFPKIKKSFKKKDQGLKPDKYWRSLLYAAFGLVILSFLFGAYNFYKINNVQVEVTEGELNDRNISKARLRQALTYFEEKNKKSEAIKVLALPVADPSL